MQKACLAVIEYAWTSPGENGTGCWGELRVQLTSWGHLESILTDLETSLVENNGQGSGYVKDSLRIDKMTMTDAETIPRNPYTHPVFDISYGY